MGPEDDELALEVSELAELGAGEVEDSRAVMLLFAATSAASTLHQPVFGDMSLHCDAYEDCAPQTLLQSKPSNWCTR